MPQDASEPRVAPTPPGSARTQQAQAAAPAGGAVPDRSSRELGSVSVEGDEVTVCYGTDTYRPVEYNSFQHGPFFVKTKVRAGETTADAAARAWNSALALAKGSYPGKAQEYLKNLRELGILTR